MLTKAKGTLKSNKFKSLEQTAFALARDFDECEPLMSLLTKPQVITAVKALDAPVMTRTALLDWVSIMQRIVKPSKQPVHFT